MLYHWHLRIPSAEIEVIANGANIILDMDDDNIPVKLNGKYMPIEEGIGSFLSPVVDIQLEGHVWNPYGAPYA